MKFQAALRGQKGETSLTSRREKSAAMGNDKSLLTVAIALSQHLIKECACSKYTYIETAGISAANICNDSG
ncbi:hypothetical protein WUBG_07499 [Wuchereria bancrofti]|uniref:Uncharacterized protein n=1 Tax=Wuchereria bancrofti TaxID=6293 RepID=J9B3P3_WUCBA|nr:hypothetical protein WUBG_07499 [Wuchereria bancrofti]